MSRRNRRGKLLCASYTPPIITSTLTVAPQNKMSLNTRNTWNVIGMLSTTFLGFVVNTSQLPPPSNNGGNWRLPTSINLVFLNLEHWGFPATLHWDCFNWAYIVTDGHYIGIAKRTIRRDGHPSHYSVHYLHSMGHRGTEKVQIHNWTAYEIAAVIKHIAKYDLIRIELTNYRLPYCSTDYNDHSELNLGELYAIMMSLAGNCVYQRLERIYQIRARGLPAPTTLTAHACNARTNSLPRPWMSINVN